MEGDFRSSEKDVMKQPGKRKPRWSMILILLVAWLVTVMPLLFWKSTWFGNRLSDRQITEYLADQRNPRRGQHALSQISDRLSRGDPTVNRFYPQVVAAAGSPVVELRMTSGWVMGQDNTYEPFHQALLKLVNDVDPLVRRNAALALVRFKDSTGRNVILEMLQPLTVVAPAAGAFKERLKPGDSVNRGTLLARISTPGSKEPVEMRSPIPGRIESQLVPDGAFLLSGAPVFNLLSDERQVWEALRALYLVGVRSDLAIILPFAHGLEGLPPRIQQQATLTVEAIQRRSQSN